MATGRAATLAGAARPAICAVACAYALTSLLIAGALLLVNDAAWWRGFVAASIATLMACVATVPVIAWAMRLASSRADLAAAAFFATAGLRAGIALGAAALAVYAGAYPKTPTMLLVVPYYFAILAVETILLVRLLWKSGGNAGPGTEKNHG
ncbi:MAG: hypothetical protein ABIP55_15815 [Tepidisphaeraceae bacterium]